jgi:hypothetical protein
MARNHRIPRRVAGVLAGGLLVAVLTACSNDAGGDAAAPTTTGGATVSETTGAVPTGTGTGTGASSTSGDTDATVDCAGNSCSVTISGDATANVLGTQISLGDVQNGRATLGVGDRQVSCAQGESVSAGPLTLECTTVTGDSVTLTARLG